MGKDPLFQQDARTHDRLAADKKVMTAATVIMIAKFVTGLIALALIVAIWGVWRLG